MDSCLMVWNFKPQMRAYRFVGHKVSVPVELYVEILSSLYFSHFSLLKLLCTIYTLMFSIVFICYYYFIVVVIWSSDNTLVSITVVAL